MTKEERAHDLAVSYVQYQKLLEFLDEDSIKMVDLEVDYYAAYEFAYSNFLDAMED